MEFRRSVILRRAGLALATLAVMIYPTITSADVVKKTFDVGPGGTLSIDTDLGSIEVRSGGNAVTVEVDRDPRTSNRERAQELLDRFDLDFRQSGNDVRITGRFDDPSGRHSSFFDIFDIFDHHDRSRLRVRYVVSVPNRFDLDLRTSGGDIRIGDLEGRVEARTSGGDLDIGRVNGPVHAFTSGGDIVVSASVGKTEVRTSGGDIVVDRSEGPVDARTSGGSIRVDRASGNVYARTSGGNIRVNDVTGAIDASTSGGSIVAHISKQPDGRCRLATSGGSITVTLAAGIGFDLDASASGGRVTTDIPMAVTGTIRSSKVAGRINDGGPDLVLRTSGGGIHLKEE